MVGVEEVFCQGHMPETGQSHPPGLQSVPPFSYLVVPGVAPLKCFFIPTWLLGEKKNTFEYQAHPKLVTASWEGGCEVKQKPAGEICIFVDYNACGLYIPPNV